MNKHVGLIYALSAYFFWGVVPLFWKQLSHIDAVQIVMHRMVWSCVLVVALIIVLRQWREFQALFKQPRQLVSLGVASTLISINWAVFIWAVDAGYLVEASLGYFINPLVTALFAFLFFQERMRKGQWFALAIATMAVVYMIIDFGAMPYIALTLAITFTCYGAVKKTIKIPATHGLAIESGFLLLPALGYLIYLDQTGTGVFGGDLESSVMLILAGLVTLVPLVLFAAAAKLVSLTTLGMTQYLGPSLILLIGVLIYNEPFGTGRMITFGLIWLAILIFTLDGLRHRRRSVALKMPI